MNKSKLSGREALLLVFLVVLLIGVVYYMGFYKPLQAELSSISVQCADTDNQIMVANAKLGSMSKMQQELDEVFARPAEEITEIAPYDNKEIVLTQLNGILARTQEYSLSFSDPEINEDGTVRRNVSMEFHCADYEDAKSVIRDLTECPWRCVVNNLTITAEDNIMGHIVEETEPAEGEEEAETQPEHEFSGVTVSATITFFESTKLAK